MCLGYSQIPGVDFSDNYAPVGNDVTFRVIMILRLMYGFNAVLLDVETAFLYGKLEEEIYMEIPSGYKEFYQDCALMSAIVTGQTNKPTTFQEAWYYDDQEKQKKWRTVIWKEFRDRIKRGVWVNVNWSSVPEEQKLIGSKWVFKEKRNR